MSRLLLALCVVALAMTASADKWAVLVAGSNTYSNYRHQSDVCHAYQILHKGGIPDDHIIVFMYDDIASSSQNPYVGKIYNSPKHVDVYAGVPKDYTKTSVTPSNFLNAIQGKATTGGSGKILKSGPDDEVFIYFSDHGATGLIAFPSSYLYSKDLIAALKYMHENKMYKKLTFYLEACESGSMFANLLPSDINIYATTAANPSESSYAYYWDSAVRAYLGDQYSIAWMENTDANDVSTYTLHEQFLAVKKFTNTSHVMQYGDLTMDSDVLGVYMAEDGHSSSAAVDGSVDGTFVSQRDAVLDQLARELKSLNGANTVRAQEIQNSIEAEMSSRKKWLSVMRNIARRVTSDKASKMFTEQNTPVFENDCLQNSVEAVETSCGKFTDYSLQFIKVLNNMCAAKYTHEQIAKAAAEVCK